MAKADHVKVYRVGYWHHGIDIGDGTVVHYTGEPGKKENAFVKRTTMEEFLDSGKIEVVEYDFADSVSIVVNRALERIGKKEYNLFTNNCEHFARFCKTGELKSEQVEDVIASTSGATSVAAGTYGGIAVASSAGSVAGLSGAGVMSGLAAIGPAGAIGGVATLAVVPAMAANMAVSKILNDDPLLSSKEREARSVGRMAAKVGTAASAVGTLATISASGTVVGLSGAGITTGLATIGGTVGGGMVAGTAVAIAAPALAATAVGIGVYKMFKWIRN